MAEDIPDIATLDRDYPDQNDWAADNVRLITRLIKHFSPIAAGREQYEVVCRFLFARHHGFQAIRLGPGIFRFEDVDAFIAALPELDGPDLLKMAVIERGLRAKSKVADA